jgi:hypothetical protein
MNLRTTKSYLIVIGSMALTIPVIILIGLFQYGAVTGNNPLASIGRSEEPFYVLSILMYIPIGIIIFVLFEQKGIMHAQAAQVQAAHALQAPSPYKKDPYQKLKD